MEKMKNQKENSKKKIKLYLDKNWLHEQYEIENVSITSMAGKCNVSPSTIYRWLVKFSFIFPSRFKGHEIHNW